MERATAEVLELGDRELVGPLKCFEETRRLFIAEPDFNQRISELAIESTTRNLRQRPCSLSPATIGDNRGKCLGRHRAFCRDNGSDGTRTRDLRRDRPAL